MILYKPGQQLFNAVNKDVEISGISISINVKHTQTSWNEGQPQETDIQYVKGFMTDVLLVQ